MSHANPLTAGVLIGIVTNNADPEGLSRVKVKFPTVTELHESDWARVVAPMAGNGRGAYFLPEVDDEVLVAFAHGDVRAPYVIGSLWNGQDKPPADNADGKNDVRVIRSRSGHVVRLNDAAGEETLEIVDASGKNRVVLETATGRVTIGADGDLVLTAPNGAIRLAGASVTIEASGDAAITARGSATIEAAQQLAVRGQTVNIN